MNREDYIKSIDKAATFLAQRFKPFPAVAIITGSGLGKISEILANASELGYQDIPGYPTPSIAGHMGRIVVGQVGDKRIAVFCGRSHIYEGLSPGEVVFPVRVLAKLKTAILLLTNAAGGLNPHFKVGDLVLIRDQINLTFRNPLIGQDHKIWGKRFPDMSQPFNPKLMQIARSVAIKGKIILREGTYLAMSGPSYETRAEVEMLRIIGADAVGMSTVPENLAAIQSGIKTLAISFIANSLVKPGVKTTHEEVLETSRRVIDTMKELITGIIKELRPDENH